MSGIFDFIWSVYNSTLPIVTIVLLLNFIQTISYSSMGKITNKKKTAKNNLVTDPVPKILSLPIQVGREEHLESTCLPMFITLWNANVAMQKITSCSHNNYC